MASVSRMSAALGLGLVLGAGAYAAYRGDLKWVVPEHEPAPEASQVGEAVASQRAGTPARGKASHAAQDSAADDSLVVPGMRVGKIGTRTSEKDIERAYGEQHVGEIDVPLGEGETEPATVVFPNDRERTLHVLWRDRARRSPSSIRIIGARWRTGEGIGIGTTLKELEEMNGRPFTLAGFGWDYSGTVYAWNGGELDRKLKGTGRVLLRLGTDPGAATRVLGDGEFPSSDPEMQSLNPRVYEMIVEFAEPDTTPARSSVRDLLVGRWAASSRAGTLSLDIRGDGTLFVRLEAAVVRGVDASGTAVGIWTRRGERFAGQIQSSETAAFPAGRTWDDEIIKVTDTELILRNQAGGLETYRRE
jgi:hypothetical protein